MSSTLPPTLPTRVLPRARPYPVAVLAVALSAMACANEAVSPTSDDGSGGTTTGNTGGGTTGSAAGGRGNGDGAGGSTGDNAAATTLPPSTFVFERLTSKKAADYGTTNELYAYDLATRTERLISKLDETTVTLGHAVSPDRRWIAFGARQFRPTLQELEHKVTALWAVTPDGGTFRRLSPNLVFNDKTDLTCSSSSECPWGEDCRGGKCVFTNLSVTTSSPVWSPDGHSIFFSHLIFWNAIDLMGFGRLTFLRSLGRITDGVLTDVAGSPCQSTGPPAIHPDGQTLLLSRASCYGAKDALTEWTMQPLAYKRSVIEQQRTYGQDVPPESDWSISGTRPAWLPGGQEALFSALGPHKVGKDAGFREGLKKWTAATGEVKSIYMPDSDAAPGVESFAVGPKGEVVLGMVVGEGDTAKRDLYLFDLASAKMMALTQDGMSASPNW
jgi:hypothetical protein